MAAFRNQDSNQLIIRVSGTDLLMTDISTATEAYENELKWDLISNHRNVRFYFEQEEVLHTDSQFNTLKMKWYYVMVKELPSILYFIEHNQFHEILNALFDGRNNRGLLHDVECEYYNARNTLQIADMEVYILESIEDLHKYNDAPIELLSDVYAGIVAIK